MQFTIDKEEFLKGLLNASRVIQSKSIDPILGNLKLDINDDYLSLTGSNGDLAIFTRIPAYKDDKQIFRDVVSGSILVSARLITEIVKRLDSEEVKFTVVDETLAKIESDNANFKLNVINAKEYRDFDFNQEGIRVTVSAKDFTNAINEVSFAASTKDARPILTAVNLECNSGILTFTSTDGSRLGRKELKVENEELFNVNVPAKTMLEAIRTIENEETVDMFISDKKILLSFNETILNSKLIGGDYPNVRNIIPKNFYYYLEVNANEFLSAINRVSLFSGERENVIKLTMNENKVVVSSKSQQVGSGEEELSLYRYSGDRLEISFNSEFVSSAIRALKSTDVLISFIGEMKPFTVTNKNDASVIQLITPVRTY